MVTGVDLLGTVGRASLLTEGVRAEVPQTRARCENGHEIGGMRQLVLRIGTVAVQIFPPAVNASQNFQVLSAKCSTNPQHHDAK